MFGTDFRFPINPLDRKQRHLPLSSTAKDFSFGLLAKVTNALNQHWQKQNAAKKNGVVEV